MLARRFTIVCLIMAIFGLELAKLVAETPRPARARTAEAIAQCVFLPARDCGRVNH